MPVKLCRYPKWLSMVLSTTFELPCDRHTTRSSKRSYACMQHGKKRFVDLQRKHQERYVDFPGPFACQQTTRRLIYFVDCLISPCSQIIGKELFISVFGVGVREHVQFGHMGRCSARVPKHLAGNNLRETWLSCKQACRAMQLFHYHGIHSLPFLCCEGATPMSTSPRRQKPPPPSTSKDDPERAHAVPSRIERIEEPLEVSSSAKSCLQLQIILQLLHAHSGVPG